MKIRNGFVSNSSSSSFVVLKDSLTDKQIDMILHYQDYIGDLISIDEENNWKNSKEFDDYRERYRSDEYQEQQYKRLRYLFEYYDTDPWKIIEYDDLIFGETSMDNFNISNFFNYIKVNNEYVKWDDGYIDSPTVKLLDFIQKSKIRIRKDKLDKLKRI